MTNAAETALRRIVAHLDGLTEGWAPASAGHLAALKLLARDDETRPQDASDLRALRTVLNDRDRTDLEQAIDLITARGYDRGRDLAALLADYLSRD